MLIKKKLQINSVVTALTAVVICLMLLMALHRVNRAMEAANCADEIINSVFERSTFREDYLRTNSERAKAQWFARHELIGRLLKSAAEKFTDGEDKKTVDEMIKDHEATGKLFSAIVKNREKAGSDAGSEALSQEIENRLLTQLIMRLYDKTLHAGKLQKAGNGMVNAALMQAGGGIVGILAILIAVAVFSSWTMNRTIADRVRRLRDGAAVIGGGDLDHRIDIKGDDEFVELSNAFNAMTAKLRGSYRELEREIEERKQAEEKLREAAADLQAVNTELDDSRRAAINLMEDAFAARKQTEADRRRLEAILETIPVGVVLIEAVTNRFSLINRRAAEIYGTDYDGVDLEEHIAKVKLLRPDGTPFPWEDLPVSHTWRGEEVHNVEMTIERVNGIRVPLVVNTAPLRDADGNVISAVVAFDDITERKQAETFRSMGQDILLVLSEYKNQKEAIKRVFDIIKSATGVDAVGIRLQDEDDFPYFYQEGFPEDFLLKENSLLARTKDGGICRDECGDICLECTCGLVVTSKTDPSIRFFTKGGSAWTNDSIPFLHVPVDVDIRTNPRDECIHQGFASVALIPIRAKGRVVGLLQLNDRRKGFFTLEGIETLEKIAENIGESMLRKQAEEALKESETKYRELVQNANSVIIRWRSDGTLLFFNEYAQSLFGYGADEIIGRDVRILVPEKKSTGGDLTELIQDIVAHPANYMNNVNENVCRDGHRIWLAWTNKPIFDEHGRVSEILAVGVDITDRKKAEEALAAAKDRLAADLDAMTRLQSLGALFVREGGMRVVLDKIVETAIAITNADMGNIQLLDKQSNCLKIMAHRGFEQSFLDFWNSVAEGQGVCGTALKQAERVIVEDVTQSPIFVGTPALDVQLAAGVRAVQSTPLVSRSGKPLGMFSTHFRSPHRPDERSLQLLDLLARQAADIIERAQIGETLRESEEQLHTLADTIPNLAWWANCDGYITWYNRRWYEYTGTTPEQMEGWGWQSVHDPDELPKVLERWQASIATGEPFEMTFPLRGADGVFHSFLTRVIPLKDATGRVLQWFGTNTDVSAMKQAEEQIKSSLAEKEVMLREIHHRVKNNLQVISSMVSLQADTLTDERIREEFNDVRDRVRSMALVHEKLYQTGDLAHLDFAEYAASLLQHLWRAYGVLAEKVRLDLEVAPVTLSIEVAVPCGLILNELAGNALKHAFPNNSSGELTVGLEHDNSTGVVLLRVRDNGIGLPPGLDWRQSRSLGLRLVQMLASQLRGRVETGPGPGAEFRVTFPLKGFQS